MFLVPSEKEKQASLNAQTVKTSTDMPQLEKNVETFFSKAAGVLKEGSPTKSPPRLVYSSDIEEEFYFSSKQNSSSGPQELYLNGNTAVAKGSGEESVNNASVIHRPSNKTIGIGRGQLMQKLLQQQKTSPKKSVGSKNCGASESRSVSSNQSLNSLLKPVEMPSLVEQPNCTNFGIGARPKTYKNVPETSISNSKDYKKSKMDGTSSDNDSTTSYVMKSIGRGRGIMMRSDDSCDERLISSASGKNKSQRRRDRRLVDPYIETTESKEKIYAEAREIKDKYASQIEGDNILRTLKRKSGKLARECAMPITTLPDKPTPRPLLGTLAHGYNAVFQYEVPELPFKEKLIKKMLERGINYAEGIQGYSWPAIMSARHVLGISTARQGKTMAYVPAIISLLMDQMTYVELPKGKGPLALIIVPSWKKAREVYECIQDFTGFKHQEVRDLNQIRTLLLYAGGTEEKEATTTDLFKGCEILIATPNSLLRVLDEEKTSMKRVCHVVLDDTDILATHFNEEICDLMEQLRIALLDRKHILIPKQILMFASQWNRELDEFRVKFTKEPIIAISSRVEASVYGGVKQVVRMSKYNSKLVAFCQLLDSLAQTNTGEKVVAFSDNVKEANEIYQASKSRSIYTLIMHHEMESSELLEQSRTQWLEAVRSRQLMVMVCTDMCYVDLCVTNATAVIHYNLPPSKSKFGNRLSCMLDYFQDKTQSVDDSSSIEPVSHIIMTEREDVVKAQSLYDMLQRCNAEMPQKFNDYLRGYQMSLENDDEKYLCPLLKAFGSCMNMSRCEYRHTVMEEHDAKITYLPAQGEVKVKVLHVDNATRYWCQLLEHHIPSEKRKIDFRFDAQKLMFDMASYFGKDKNHVPFLPSENPSKDELCGFRDRNNIVHRVRVEETREGSMSSPMLQCKVWLVDQGVYKTGTVDQLVQLPKDLAEVPYLAVEVFACRIKPMDKDSEWTDMANIFVHELVEGKELHGRIVLRLGMTLWLDPLVHQVSLKGVTANAVVIHNTLVDNNLAITNQDHIPNLYELCRGKTEIPEIIMRKYFNFSLENELMQETLNNKQEYHNVLIAHVESPDHFYIQRDETINLLEELESLIAEKMESSENPFDEKTDGDKEMEPDSVCIARGTDGFWSRGKVLSKSEDSTLEVFFLDYGFTEFLSVENVKPLPREFAELPCQAIECSLAHILPEAMEWSKNTIDIMCDQAYTVKEKKTLYAKVLNRVEPIHTMGQKLELELFDNRGVQFAQELIWRQEALPRKKTENLDVLIGKPALKNQMFFNPIDKVAYLSAQIYWIENDIEAIKQAEEILLLLSPRDVGWDANLEQRGVLLSVLKIIGYIKCERAHGLILRGLTSCCRESARICEICIDNNLIPKLVYCLEQDSRKDIRLQAIESIVELSQQNKFVTACCEDAGSQLIFILSLLLESFQQNDEPSKTIKLLCKASAEIIKESRPETCKDLKQSEIVDLIFKVVSDSNKDDNDKEPWLELLSGLSKCKSMHPLMIRESFLNALTSLLKDTSSQTALCYALATLQDLVYDNRKNKRILLEHKLVILLNDLVDSGVTSPALEMCRELQGELTLQVHF